MCILSHTRMTLRRSRLRLSTLMSFTFRASAMCSELTSTPPLSSSFQRGQGHLFKTIDYLATNQRKEMSNCGNVSMDRYWSYVATPLFFVTIGFGLYTLFNTQDIHLVPTKSISSTVAAITSGAKTPASVAAPAAP